MQQLFFMPEVVSHWDIWKGSLVWKVKQGKDHAWLETHSRPSDYCQGYSLTFEFYISFFLKWVFWKHYPTWRNLIIGKIKACLRKKKKKHCHKEFDLVSWSLFIFNIEFYGSSRGKPAYPKKLFFCSFWKVPCCHCVCTSEKINTFWEEGDWYSLLFPFLLSTFTVFAPQVHLTVLLIPSWSPHWVP